jgi:hypothetical protein
MHGMTLKHHSPRNHFVHWHPVDHSLGILNVPTFGIHVNKAISHKEIILTTKLNDLFMNVPALFKRCYTGTCI